jgi:hypothetical protein
MAVHKRHTGTLILLEGNGAKLTAIVVLSPDEFAKLRRPFSG